MKIDLNQRYLLIVELDDGVGVEITSGAGGSTRPQITIEDHSSIVWKNKIFQFDFIHLALEMGKK